MLSLQLVLSSFWLKSIICRNVIKRIRSDPRLNAESFDFDASDIKEIPFNGSRIIKLGCP